ncbi:hypothetical protein CERZMDRAFT_100047 [Cercospora zeae-maydis SCOH1-5]|uniref:Aminoglycoside phosphotransferase domain-containing protein n=1 Tax=Cercospora zeae-maydis SCOH1-5 TaxID=717836 RepID=A0A6A6F9C3_9PEZI|nr:hypothetical protein CERZMDRAFT_100047 [Cercospora zeae-maydis SCOH1-5]
MDISLRNLIFGDGFVCLLDWEFAGYFQITAEIASLRLDIGDSLDDLRFSEQLDEATTQLSSQTTEDNTQIRCWQELSLNHIRYYWPTAEEELLPRKRHRGQRRAKCSASNIGEATGHNVDAALASASN